MKEERWEQYKKRIDRNLDRFNGFKRLYEKGFMNESCFLALKKHYLNQFKTMMEEWLNETQNQ